MSELPSELPPCWGTFYVPAGKRAQWHIYAARLALERGGSEWLMTWAQGEAEGLDFIGLEDAAQALDDLAPGPRRAWAPLLGGRVRIATQRAGTELVIYPGAADRPVVARPEVPLQVPPGDAIRLYLGTPAWITVAAGGVQLAELPSRRLSDTWFGDVDAGELCYASRTAASADLSAIQDLPGRVLTPVSIKNASSEAFRVERIKLPIPMLQLYVAPDGRLWSEGLILEAVDGGLGSVRFGHAAPPEAGAAKPIGKPRVPRERHNLIRAIGALFD